MQGGCAAGSRFASSAMKRSAILLLMFVVPGGLPGTPALAAEGGRIHVPTVTRLVKIFSELEADLMTNIRNGNADTVQKMLADDFEMWSSPALGAPTPRADWIRRSLEQPQSVSSIEQMAVRDFGNIAIASFLMGGGPDAKPGRDRAIFVVDIWQRAGASWKLATRYAGLAGSKEFVIPGASKAVPEIEKRY
jgi:hypothetical protein